MIEKMIIITAFILYGLFFAGGIAWEVIRRKKAELDDELRQKEIDRDVGRLRAGEGLNRGWVQNA